jgi:flagellar hook-associated protein 3 FlgL
MRVTSAEMYRNFLSDLEKLNTSYNKVSQQISSGKRLAQLKDSPAGCAELVSLTELASEIDTYRSNMDSGSYFLRAAESALNEVNNIFTSLYTRGSQAGSELMTQEARAAIGTEVRTLRDQILSLANSQVRGRYIFGGSQTLSPPFELTGDSVAYQGDDEVTKAAINEGVEVSLGVTGDETFNAVFVAIESLLTALDGNDVPGIQSALSQFSSAFTELGQVRGQIGSNLSVMDHITTVLDSKELNLKERRGKIEDANIAEAAVKLKQIQTALQAAISSGGNMLSKPNLFDILG